jgi:hypothetical protein
MTNPIFCGNIKFEWNILKPSAYAFFLKAGDHQGRNQGIISIEYPFDRERGSNNPMYYLYCWYDEGRFLAGFDTNSVDTNIATIDNSRHRLRITGVDEL